MAEEKSVKKLHSEERNEPYNTPNWTNNIVQELSEKWPKGRKETLTRRSPIKVVKTTTNRVTKDRKKTSAKSLKEVLITESSHTKY